MTTSYLIIEKGIDNDFLMEQPLIGLMSEVRCPNCGFKLYLNSYCHTWCPECDFQEFDKGGDF